MVSYGTHYTPSLFSLPPSLTYYLFSRFGRDNFQESMKIASRMDFSKINWRKFKYMVFDIPNHPGSYEQRYTAMGITTPPPPPPSHSLTQISS